MVTDPPYGVTSLPWDRWQNGWLEAVADSDISSLWCFGSMRMFLEHAQEFAATRWKMSQDVVWEKHNGSSFHADRVRRVHEHVLHFYRGPWSKVWKQPQTTPDAVAKTARRKARPPHMGDIGGGEFTSYDGGPRLLRSVVRMRSMHGRARHPTEKPIGLLAPLIRYVAAPGETIIDPFCGSGSALEAALLTGHRAIGIESHEPYAEIAALRLSQNIFLNDNYSGDAS
ncbi:DNA-methyltransferase [Streptosporangium lutulentum]|nr:site-specific DNA-methyltransferase [Streptosporangium lutulentum]